MAEVRVRFAPSPTGFPHIGNIRTALFNWLFARHHGGEFILRIEDTDQSRLVPGALEAILASVRWLGLDWDEGPEVGGPHAPYFQSQRLPIYRRHAEELVERGHAYRCYCTPERLEQVRAEQTARKEPIRYDRACRELPPQARREKEAAGLPYVIRFKAPLSGQTTFHDLFRGDISFDNAELDDHVLLKSDGWPTYQLGNVVDDHLMGVTHVLRGDEWISSTPKHVLEYRAFGWELPLFGHLALILGKDRTKLSKRHGATDILTYRDRGYLPEAMVNFLALLGWSPPEELRGEKGEILSRDELIQLFDLDRIGVTPSVFDTDKLDWMNGNYIRQLSEEELAERIIPFLQQAGLLPADVVPPEQRAYVRQIVPLIRERMKLLAEAPQLTDFFFRPPAAYDPGLLVPKGVTREQTRAALAAARERAASLPDFTEERLEEALRALAADLGLKSGQLFGALRVAVTGRPVAPPLFATLAVLGRARTLDRLAQAIDLL